MSPIRQDNAVRFYDRFFETTPDARQVFPDDMKRLHLKLMDTIAAIVGALDNRALLQSIISNTASHHTWFGVSSSQYSAFGKALRLVGRRCGRVFVAALFLVPLSPAMAAEVLYSRTAGSTCQRFYETRSIATHCRGPAGYVAVIVDRDRVINVNYGRLSNGRLDRGLDRSDLLWRGAARLIDDRIEWRVLRGRPFAAIIRIFTLTEDDDPLQQLLIAKVTPSGSCEIARINVLDPNAHGTARDIADSQAPIVDCEFEARR